MRRRRPDAAADMPPNLLLFDPASWIDPGDQPEDAERLARERWNQARQAWGAANGWDPLSVLRAGLNARRIADGLPPFDYDRRRPRRWVTPTIR